MKQLYIFVLCFLAVNCCQAQNIYKTIMVDGLRRQYIIHLPPGCAALTKPGVLFALHGGGGTAKGAVTFYSVEPLADKNNFIVVYPDAVNKTWSIPGMASRLRGRDTAVNDLHFMNMLLDTLITYYKADPAKVFLAGISRGAMFSYYLADAMNDRITGIAAVCGGISQTQLPSYSFKNPIPVLIINGTRDPLVKYDGGYGKLNKRNQGNEDADMLPAEELVKKIVSMNGCNAMPETLTLPDAVASDGCTETEYVYEGPGKVNFIKIENGGHAWPGGGQYLPAFLIGKVCRDFSASQKIFDFFMGIVNQPKSKIINPSL